MARQDYSQYQQDVIAGYYRHLDTTMLYKLQTLVSELYLAETDAKRNRLWQRVRKAMDKLNVPSPLVEHIMSGRDVEVLAKNLQDWLKNAENRG